MGIYESLMVLKMNFFFSCIGQIETNDFFRSFFQCLKAQIFVVVVVAVNISHIIHVTNTHTQIRKKSCQKWPEKNECFSLSLSYFHGFLVLTFFSDSWILIFFHLLICHLPVKVVVTVRIKSYKLYTSCINRVVFLFSIFWIWILWLNAWMI